MTYFERLEELKNNTNFTLENYDLAYLTTEIVLVDLLGEYIKGAEITSPACGLGRITETSGDNLETMLMTVEFADQKKKFAVLPVITSRTVMTKFADISEVGDAWDEAYSVHNEITKKYKDLKELERKNSLEAQKKAEAEKKAELKYQHLKEKAIKDFEALTTKAKTTITEADEFYYALGWLASHIGSVSAALPDYLAPAFTKHFGTETGARVVDSKKKTVGGYSMQWTFGFKANLRKFDNIPALLTQHLSTTGKSIASTSFIWDLIENFGFQFGKKQDIDKIKQTIPETHLISFEAGMMA